jgi:vancomycin resistance protein YoaR
VKLDDQANTPAQDATLNFDGANAQVTPAQAGSRLDLGQLTELIDSRLSQTSTQGVVAPVYQLAPKLGTAPLQAAIGQVASYLSAPITVAYSGRTTTISQSTLTSWIQAESDQTPTFLKTLKLNDLYPPVPSASLSLNQSAVATYVAGMASDIDKSAVNAVLGVQDSQPVVLQASRDGLTVNQTQAVSDIIASLAKTGADRTVNLNLQTTTAAVNETNLTSLGITGLISEGETYFPGSPSGRLTNVRLGAARFNDVLIAPGQVFSTGAQLGEVDGSTGYVPELVIIGNHEELQYGGGLCQVNTTAFRAALLAGLPINEREAHSFAISYYQWPYTAPGVDATIYYPQVDLKFTNDTGHYILIQTTMKGDDLKFDFYGTKVESGVIRGPYFVTGSNNTTVASHTIFYRDVEDPTGKVVRTDSFNSYYQPSTDFPIIATTN